LDFFMAIVRLPSCHKLPVFSLSYFGSVFREEVNILPHKTRQFQYD
jgi:hypothetical protein